MPENRPMTLAQRRILDALLARAGEVVSRSELINAMMVDAPEAPRPRDATVDVQVHFLRKSLLDSGPLRIETVFAQGYRIFPGGLREQIRNEALLEAAALCDSKGYGLCAKAIRGLTQEGDRLSQIVDCV